MQNCKCPIKMFVLWQSPQVHLCQNGKQSHKFQEWFTKGWIWIIKKKNTIVFIGAKSIVGISIYNCT